MKKVVAFLPEQEVVKNADNEFTHQDITNFHCIKVADDYEEQIRQEIFLTAQERKITIISALMGGLLGSLLLVFLLSNNNFGQVLTPLLANTIYSTIFTGVGVGLAAGGLLGGLYAMYRPLPLDLTGYTMLVVYCTAEEIGKAKEIINNNSGIFL